MKKKNKGNNLCTHMTFFFLINKKINKIKKGNNIKWNYDNIKQQYFTIKRKQYKMKQPTSSEFWLGTEVTGGPDGPDKITVAPCQSKK